MRPLLVVAVALGAVLLPASAAHAAFPGENGKLVFSSAPEEAGSYYGADLHVMDPRGRVLTLLGQGFEPAFSPDGGRIAFTASSSGGTVAIPHVLFMVDADGTNLRQITSGGGTDYGDNFPSWAPDGERVVFVRNGSRILVVEADGTGDVTDVSPPGNDAYYADPVFSPDGETIVFLENDPDRSAMALHAMDADGSNVRRLTTWAASYRSPSFSPDGQWIAFERQGRGGVGRIFKMEPDGSNVTPLAQGASPAFSPNGKQIAFARHPEIYVMDANGGSVRKTPSRGVDRRWSPDWGPEPVGPGAGCARVNATIEGTALADQIFGTHDRDVIQAGAGDDVILGGRRGDRICGGPGADKVKAHKGPDRLVGGPGNDILRGNQGRDALFGAKGFDRCFGGKDPDAARCEREKSAS